MLPLSSHSLDLVSSHFLVLLAFLLHYFCVGIPYAVRKSGFVAGILLILFVALVTEKSLRLLIFTAKHVHVPTYEMLAESCFGIIGFRFVAINMFITAYGAMVSYLMLVKDCFGTLLLGNDEATVAPHDSDLMRRAILIVISLAIMLPLSCKRDMADLAKTSRLNVLIDSTLVALVAYNAPIRAAAEEAASQAVPPNLIFHGDTIFVGLGVLSFAFVCQHSAFIIAGSLENPTAKRWSMVSAGALTVCAVLALVCGTFGFLGYRNKTEGNILQNLDADSISANIARALLGTTMLFVYPLESFVTRHVCVVLLFTGRLAHEGEDSHILSRRDRRIGLTTALYILAVVPASLFKDLGNVLALTGAIGGSCLAYLGPGAAYLGVHGERFIQLVHESSWWGSGKSSNGCTDEENTKKAKGDIRVVSPGPVRSSVLAVETTPLVAGGSATAPREGKQEDAGDDAIVISGFLNKITWYLFGMPIWCAIAQVGRKRLEQYAHDMAMKSPHPIRIGDVEYKRMVVNVSDSEEGMSQSQLQKLVRENSAPSLRGDAATKSPNLIAPSSGLGGNINQQIGKDLLEQQQKKKKAQKLEADPQQEPPTWLDFYIAIAFILLGLVALFAGIYSLLREKES